MLFEIRFNYYLHYIFITIIIIIIISLFNQPSIYSHIHIPLYIARSHRSLTLSLEAVQQRGSLSATKTLYIQ